MILRLIYNLCKFIVAMNNRPIPPPRGDFGKAIDKLRAEIDQRKVAHREARFSRGLSEEAKSGTPEARLVLFPAAGDEISWEPYRGMLLTEARERAYADRDRNLYATMPIGASRVGGMPDLPPEIEWPTHEGKKQRLLAQISLADVAAWNNPLLPKE